MSDRELRVFDGATAFITGGAYGIGRALALEPLWTTFQGPNHLSTGSFPSIHIIRGERKCENPKEYYSQ
jgi:hypothetical protein